MTLTLTQIRQRLGVELGVFRSSTATAGSTVNALEDTAYPFKTNFPEGADADFSKWWLFRPAAAAPGDVQRRVLTYAPRAGFYTPDAPWTSAPASGEAYELWNVGLGLAELNRAVNDGLKRLYATDKLWVVPAVDNLRRIALTPYATWLTNPRWVQQVSVQSEGRKTTASMSASAALANNSANAILTWKRDPAQSGIRRRQIVTNEDLINGTLFIATWTNATRRGNTLFAFLTSIGGTVTAPSGWTLLTSVLQGTTRTSVYYITGVNSSRLGPEMWTLSTTSVGTITLVEYDGLLPNGLDVSATAGSTTGALSTGTTSVVAQADELWLAILGTANGPQLFDPSNRFTLVNEASTASATNPAYHWLYERMNTVTSLDDMPPTEIRGGAVEPIREEGGVIFLYPDRPITSPSAYVIDTLRPLYTYCAPDSSGMLGTKTDGLTAEGNVADGDVNEEVYEAIVNAAIVAALSNYPNFREWALKSDRKERIREARAKMLAYDRSSHFSRRSTFTYQEPVG